MMYTIIPEAIENAFEGTASDPRACLLFFKTHNGLWYEADGSDGTFHDVVVPDTVRQALVIEEDQVAMPPLLLLVLSLSSLVVLALVITELRKVGLLGWGILAVALLIGLLSAGNPHDFLPVDRSSKPSTETESDPPLFSVPGYDTLPHLFECRDTSFKFELPGGEKATQARLLYKGGFRSAIPLEPIPGKERTLAWDRRTCQGFMETGPGRLVHFDATTGEVRRAFIRKRAHFFAWPDTVPEVKKWWEDDLLLPPGREPDVLLLPPEKVVVVPRKALFIVAWMAGWLLIGTVVANLVELWGARRRS